MNFQAEKRWLISEPDQERVAHIAESLGCPAVIAQVLMNRGVATAHDAAAFCDPSLDRLHDPFLMDDMHKAVQRLKQALERREKILVFGDYDVDGITAAALLVRELDTLGCPTYYYIPNRLVEGYGLSKERVEKAHQEGIGLIITVDNGVSSHEEVKLASKYGMDVIVCDHHEPEGQLPAALAILNPKRSGSGYPFRELSGVGVAFKLATALLGRLPKNLDFAALGTIADIVPLIDENRVLASAGLKMMNEKDSLSIGLAELCRVSGLEGRAINSNNIAFQLAPRLNAAGRLGVAQLGVQLLLTTSQPLAQRIARKLDEENRNRQTIEDEILSQALAKLEKDFDPQRDFSIVLHDTRWHPGVIGIVASKLVELYHRPTILIALGEHTGKGSARSIHNFHIYDALCKCQQHLVGFGGHRYAAGLTVETARLADCCLAFEQVCRDRLCHEDLRPVSRADAVLDFTSINADLIQWLERLGPFGNANPVPVFASMGVSVAGAVRVLRGDHLKCALRQAGKTLPAIGFRMAEHEGLASAGSPLDVLYTPQFNTYQGVTTIQLSLREMRPHRHY